jgi:hypothetical protein
VFPIMKHMISSEGSDVMEEVLELVAYFTYYSPGISPAMWSLWPQARTQRNAPPLPTPSAGSHRRHVRSGLRWHARPGTSAATVGEGRVSSR